MNRVVSLIQAGVVPSVLVLMLASGCAVVHPVVPVVGETGDTAALVGVWTGSYHNLDAERRGTIHFELVAEADSAVGEVVMTYLDDAVSFVPPHDRTTGNRGPHLETEVLTIRLVRLGGDRVWGRLDPYPNPDCGCTLYTTFEGAIAEDDVIEGVFVARTAEPGHVQRGTWHVARR